jgi:hypothetical protein
MQNAPSSGSSSLTEVTFAPEPDPTQMHLGEVLPVPAQPVAEHKSIAAHTQRVAQKDGVFLPD